MIVGIVGKIGAGKTEVARIVQELYPDMNWQERGFADRLRHVAHLFLGMPALNFKSQDVKNQVLGDEWSALKCHFNCFDDNGKWVELSDVMTDARSESLVKTVEWIATGFQSKDGIDFVDWSTNPPSVRSRPTVRTFLQRLGTEAIRDVLHENAWCNALMVDYKMQYDSNGSKWSDAMIPTVRELGHKLFYPNWLIPDTRFPNELEAITSRGGICIRIVRPDNPYPKSDHISETALDGVELVAIINDGSLEQLRMRVKEVFDTIVKNLGK